MTIEEINNIACQIIAYAGDAKSYCMEAIDNAADGDFEEAKSNLTEGNSAIQKAHEIHTGLLVQEAREPGCITATMMLIHASNHLSSAEQSSDFAEKLINVYQNMNK